MQPATLVSGSGDSYIRPMDPEPVSLDVESWVNSDPIDLADLRGKVIFLEAFQMLCPGCVSHGLPQAKRVRQTYESSEVAVIGLHTVFEHHDVMGPDALKVFLSEYRISFPVAVDRPVPGQSMPATMSKYQLRGTPSTLLIDKHGRLRSAVLGSLDDLKLGTHIGKLLAEPGPELNIGQSAESDSR